MLTLCGGVSHRLHRSGMLVFGLCISQCVSRVRAGVEDLVSDQSEGNSPLLLNLLYAKKEIKPKQCYVVYLKQNY